MQRLSDVSGNAVVGGLTVMNSAEFMVTDDAEVRATYLPIDHYDGQTGVSGVAGTAVLYGDIVYLENKNEGSYKGLLDYDAPNAVIEDINIPPPYAWRP